MSRPLLAHEHYEKEAGFEPELHPMSPSSGESPPSGTSLTEEASSYRVSDRNAGKTAGQRHSKLAVSDTGLSARGQQV